MNLNNFGAIFFNGTSCKKVSFNGQVVWNETLEEEENMLAGNWKMNLTKSEVEAYLRAFTPNLTEEIVLFPSHDCLVTAVAEKKLSNISIGAQDVSRIGKGAFTGQISARNLEDIGVKYALVGQSETRFYLNVTDSDCNQKIAQCNYYNIIPILCVGESLEQRETGQTESVLTTQLGAFSGSSLSATVPFHICYEPIWAIGTGKTCSPEIVNQTMLLIRDIIAQIYGMQAVENSKILYGGSVTANNIAQYANECNVDGFLASGGTITLARMNDLIDAYKNR